MVLVAPQAVPDYGIVEGTPTQLEALANPLLKKEKSPRVVIQHDTEQRQLSPLTVAAILLFALVSGSSFLFTKETVKKLPACSITALRLAIGSAGLLLVNLALVRRTDSRVLKLLMDPRVVLIGLLNTAVPYTVNAEAIRRGVQVWFAAVTSGVAPFFATVLVRCGAKQAARPSQMEIGGLLLGNLGLVIQAAGGGSAHDHDASAPSFVAAALQFSAVACKATAPVLAQRHLRHRKGECPLQFALAQTLCGLAGALVLAALVDASPLFGGDAAELAHQLSGFNVWKQLLYLGLASSCLAYLCQYYLVQHVGAVKQLSIDMLTPIVGVVEGGLIACELCNISNTQKVMIATGTALTTAGVVAVQLAVLGSEPRRNFTLRNLTELLSPSASPNTSPNVSASYWMVLTSGRQ